MKKPKNPPVNAVGTSHGTLRNSLGTLKGRLGTVGGLPSKRQKPIDG
jgi:hypothetical protein